jgi:hypothetical protein
MAIGLPTLWTGKKNFSGWHFMQDDRSASRLGPRDRLIVLVLASVAGITAGLNIGPCRDGSRPVSGKVCR